MQQYPPPNQDGPYNPNSNPYNQQGEYMPPYPNQPQYPNQPSYYPSQQQWGQQQYPQPQVVQVQIQPETSYTTPAVLILILYWLGWLPGFVANIIFLVLANGTKRRIGRRPDGYGCLIALMFFCGGGLFIVLGVYLFFIMNHVILT